jgi:hypothetical protein
MMRNLVRTATATEPINISAIRTLTYVSRAEAEMTEEIPPRGGLGGGGGGVTGRGRTRIDIVSSIECCAGDAVAIDCQVEGKVG